MPNGTNDFTCASNVSGIVETCAIDVTGMSLSDPVVNYVYIIIADNKDPPYLAIYLGVFFGAVFLVCIIITSSFVTYFSIKWKIKNKRMYVMACVDFVIVFMISVKTPT